MIAELIAVASIAFAITRLPSLESLRAAAKTSHVLAQLTGCAYCIGFWASFAVAARSRLDLLALGGLAGLAFGGLVALAMRWDRRTLVPTAKLGGLLGVLAAGVPSAYLSRPDAPGLVLGAFLASLASLVVTTVLDGLMRFADLAGRDRADWP